MLYGRAWEGDYLVHLREKHGGSQFVALKILGKFFPPWTVSRDFWHAALQPGISGIAVDLRLFHESGCRLVHKYRIYSDPLPHPALRNGVVRKLIGVVVRAMAIVWLTHLHLTIPSSGSILEPARGNATRLFHFPGSRRYLVGFRLPGRLQSLSLHRFCVHRPGRRILSLSQRRETQCHVIRV